ncbi:MAG: periplasmic heavy metal sensor [Pseudomonadota bacterium]
MSKTNADKKNEAGQGRGSPKRRSFVKTTGIAVVSVLALVGAAKLFGGAFSHGPMSAAIPAAMADPFGLSQGSSLIGEPLRVRKARFGGFLSGGMSPQKAERRALRAAKRLAKAVDATPEQAEQFQTIARQLVADIFPVRKEMRAARREAVTILLSDTPDLERLETLRATQVTRMESASRSLVTALAELSKTLTSEQRAELGERLETARELRRWWRGRRSTE